MCATRVARKVELNEARGIKEPPPDWKLQPFDEYESPAWQPHPRRNDAA